MKRTLASLQCLMVALLIALPPNSLEAKSYSSRGGRSYSSSRSSSSGGSRSSGSSMGSSRSSSSRPSRSSSSEAGSSRSSKGFTSGSGKSYGSSSSDTKNYTSGKSYTSGAAKSEPDSTTFTFDRGAARARQEETSRKSFNDYKDSMARKNGASSSSSGGAVPPRIDTPSQPAFGGSGGGGSSWSGRRTYIPDQDTVRTRPWRMYERYAPYYSRPVVVYRDSYNSFFWWWLLDRSLDERAYWAYHHRYDMDPARYQALVADNRDLQSRVEQLEAQRVPRDTNYVPANLDRDLMYSDRHVSQVYSNRPTAAGALLFWLFAIPTALGIGVFFVWLIFFKRWKVSTA